MLIPLINLPPLRARGSSARGAVVTAGAVGIGRVERSEQRKRLRLPSSLSSISLVRVFKGGENVGGRKNKSLFSAPAQKQEAGRPIRCHVRTSPLPRALFVFLKPRFFIYTVRQTVVTAFCGITPLSNDGVTVTEVFTGGDALSDLIRGTHFPAKTPTQQPRVGDYSCLYFISFGSIFILFTCFFPTANQLIKSRSFWNQKATRGTLQTSLRDDDKKGFCYIVALRSIFFHKLFFSLIVFTKQEMDNETILGDFGEFVSPRAR